MKADPVTSGRSITREVLAYLAKHPRAQDTLEGIVEWWLLEHEIDRRTAEVKEALLRLLEKGLVIERKGKDGRSRYRINQQKQHAIHELLSVDPTQDE